jgi:nickel-type superoxide dismutase maturation protease
MAGPKRDRPSFWALFVRSALMAVSATLAVQAARRLRRFEISGRSMAPALEPGDWVLVDEFAYRGRLPRRGEIVVATDPREPGRDLVKRVSAVDLHGGVSLEGDNPDESTDSRQFGPVPASSVKGRVRWRYWPLGRVGAVN